MTGTVLRRKMMDDLVAWRGRPDRKSLLIRGQRQTGKTFIVRQFARNYSSSIEIALDKQESMRRLFRTAESVDDILSALEARDPNFRVIQGDTLVFLDEIQSCPAARSFLKQFTEDDRVDVIASGSLLGVPIKVVEKEESKDISMKKSDFVPTVPVGYEDHLTMRSLDFEEFLWAKGYRDEVIGRIKSNIRDREPFLHSTLSALESLFKEYMMIGGMPEAVEKHVSGGSIHDVKRVLDGIMQTTHDDIIKYSSDTEAMKIRRCMDSLPAQLSDNNKKFMYSRIGGPGSRDGARMFSDALLWIEGSGLGNMCRRLTSVEKPLSLHVDRDNFKAYVSDTGLLVRMSDGDQNGVLEALSRDDLGCNRGALMENVVAECLMKSGIPPTYYINRKNPGRMELDFVIALGPETAVIEVKSGKERSAPSLSKTIGDGRFDRRIMFENANVSVDGDGVEHYPLFASAFIREMAKSESWMDEFDLRTSGAPPELLFRGHRSL